MIAMTGPISNTCTLHKIYVYTYIHLFIFIYTCKYTYILYITIIIIYKMQRPSYRLSKSIPDNSLS